MTLAGRTATTDARGAGTADDLRLDGVGVGVGVELLDVCKVFESEGGPVTAVDDVTLTVQPVEFVSIIGPSGCGKSTLLRIIAGLTGATGGRVLVANVSPEEARKNRLYSFAFQDSAMLPWRSVLANVELPLELMGSERRERSAIARTLIQRVGLAGFEDVRPAQLSGGMRQRVALARALSSSPKLLLMDEPFGALDEITRAHMNLVLLEVLKAQRVTVLMVTHSIEEAVFLSNRVVVMSPRPGRIKAIYDIDLPSLRDGTTKNTQQFFQHVSQLRSALEFETDWQ